MQSQREDTGKTWKALDYPIFFIFTKVERILHEIKWEQDLVIIILRKFAGIKSAY